MSTLRSKVIRLAHQNPDLRPHLLPLLVKTGAEKTPYPQLKAVLRSLDVGDQVEVIFQPRASTYLPEKRVVTVDSIEEGAVYTTSGKVRPGSVAGGRIHDDGDEVYFQPTIKQQVREVYSLRRL